MQHEHRVYEHMKVIQLECKKLIFSPKGQSQTENLHGCRWGIIEQIMVLKNTVILLVHHQQSQDFLRFSNGLCQFCRFHQLLHQKGLACDG